MRIAVAGLSARMMVDAVVRGGDSAIALDLFGDTDTRRAAAEWHAIGSALSMQVDDEALLSALHDVAVRRDTIGWVAGSGFEARPDLLERGAAVLPLLGTRPEAQRRLRDPKQFFATLSKLDVLHPETRLDAPPQPEGWLAKDAGGSGGWHVHRAADAFAAPPAAARYWQRQVAGEAMSATFIANGGTACVLGFNRLLTKRVGMRPHVFRGVVGPISIDDEVGRDVRGHVERLTHAFGLRGLCSLDFMLDGAKALVLEINARPPGSLCLYSSRRPGLMRAHVRSSQRGRLPAPSRPGSKVHGHEIVFASTAWKLDESRAAALAARDDCHDIPAAGTSFHAGDPVCSVTASGTSAARVTERLGRAIERITLDMEATA